MNFDLPDPSASIWSDGEKESEQSLPTASARESEVVFAPEQARRFVEDLSTCAEKAGCHFFSYILEAFLMTDFES